MDRPRMSPSAGIHCLTTFVWGLKEEGALCADVWGWRGGMLKWYLSPSPGLWAGCKVWGQGDPKQKSRKDWPQPCSPPPTPPRRQSSCELGETSPFLGNLKKQHLGHKCRILRKTPLSRRHPGKPERRGKHKGTSFTYLPDEWTNVSETPPGDLGREWCRSPSGARSR